MLKSSLMNVSLIPPRPILRPNPRPTAAAPDKAAQNAEIQTRRQNRKARGPRNKRNTRKCSNFPCILPVLRFGSFSWGRIWGFVGSSWHLPCSNALRYYLRVLNVQRVNLRRREPGVGVVSLGPEIFGKDAFHSVPRKLPAREMGRSGMQRFAHHVCNGLAG